MVGAEEPREPPGRRGWAIGCQGEASAVLGPWPTASRCRRGLSWTPPRRPRRAPRPWRPLEALRGRHGHGGRVSGAAGWAGRRRRSGAQPGTCSPGPVEPRWPYPRLGPAAPCPSGSSSCCRGRDWLLNPGNPCPGQPPYLAPRTAGVPAVAGLRQPQGPLPAGPQRLSRPHPRARHWASFSQPSSFGLVPAPRPARPLLQGTGRCCTVPCWPAALLAVPERSYSNSDPSWADTSHPKAVFQHRNTTGPGFGEAVKGTVWFLTALPF